MEKGKYTGFTFSNTPEVIYPEESVYNCIPKETIPYVKPPRHVSKFRNQVLEEEKSNKDLRKTMGPAKMELPPPENYLRKRSKEPKLPDTRNCSKTPRKDTCTRLPLRARVPARTEKPLMGLYSDRNYVQTPECGVTKKPQPITVDSYKGDKQHLESAGLLPKYTKKKGFGEIPKYLQERIDQKRKVQEEYEQYLREEKEREAMKHISEEEKQVILEGLRKNWDKLLREYQGLSLVIDTFSKKARKQRLEDALNELEKEIDLLQRFKTCYITDL